MTRTREERRRSQRRASGFTLVELMATVVLVAILGALATYGMRKYIITSKTAEATDMIAMIKAAQEAYRAETFVYKDISGAGNLDDFTSFHPGGGVGGRTKRSWDGLSGAVPDAWRELGVNTNSPVLYTYGCAAGPGSTAPVAPKLPKALSNYPSAADGQPWYVVEAVADLDADTYKGYWIGVSFSGQIFHEHDPTHVGGEFDDNEE
ncbi:MAG TPA: prepilin-type N-terminal cleavage/methylation domain-containing protein [Polyangiaceae bacterium]|nr:prepilin-type N-terminal cleavage/methylation domain-containing protein [Polyangiaceae bacterium]